MEHYKNLMSALGAAMPVCMTWILAGTDEDYFNARDVFAFALSEGGDDEEMGEDMFYVVSSEGAIGLAEKFEYLTNWLFIPVYGDERKRELARLQEELEYDKEHENYETDENEYSGDASENSQGAPYQQQPMPPQGAPYQQPPVPPAPPQGVPQMGAQPGQKRFCMQCGFQLNLTSKFCPKCGTPVQR